MIRFTQFEFRRLARWIYLGPLGALVHLVQKCVSLIQRPYMVYGFKDHKSGRFRKYTRVSSTALLIEPQNIEMGDHVWIWHHSIIDGSNDVRIGEGAQIGAWVGIFSHGSATAIRLLGKSYIEIPREERIGYTRAAVDIGEYTFIGAGAMILPGVSLGRGCVVAAGAVVSKSAPEFSIVAGAPAKVVGSVLPGDKKLFDDPLVQENYFARDIIEQFADSSK